MEINFGASAPHTVGIEEEFQLVDPASLALVPAIDAVLAARRASELPEDSIASELSASCVELRSPVYGTVAELAAELPSLRRRLRDLVEGCGARLAAAGSHPFSEATAQRITDEQRYRRVDKEMGWPARMQAIYGLHVHVAVPDEEHAIRAVAALSRHEPLFVALSTNSPFWAGSDSRLASVRTKVFGLAPRTGLPPTSVPGRSSRATWTPSSPPAASRITPCAGRKPGPTRGSAPSSSARRTRRRRPPVPSHWPRSPSASWPPPTNTHRRTRYSRRRTSGARPATG